MVSFKQFYSRRYLILLLFLCLLYFFKMSSTDVYQVIVSSYVQEKHRITLWKKSKKNLSCYYSVQDDVLPSVEDPNVFLGNNSIFFHETSCHGGINSRVACIVEAAARLHPNRQVNLLFNSPITESILLNSSLTKLREFSNVNFYRIHFKQYGKGTVVENIIANHLHKSTHPIEHASDILRFLTLYKFGGVYLDTDSLLVKNLDALPPNYVAKQTDKDMSAGMIALSKDETGSNLTSSLLLELSNTFDPRGWAVNGPMVLQRVVQKICQNVLEKSDQCEGLTIFPSKLFYPIPYEDHKKYFTNGSLDNMEGVYMHHMWNYLTEKLKIEMDSPYVKLAKVFCPTIYYTYGDDFGE